jgi:hypothetical protein
MGDCGGLEGVLDGPDERGWRSGLRTLYFDSPDDLEKYVLAQVEGLPGAVSEWPDVSEAAGPFTVKKSVHWFDKEGVSALVTGWWIVDGRYMLAEEIVSENPAGYCFRFEMVKEGGDFDRELARRKRLVEVKYGSR